MNYAIELGVRGLLRQPRTMALSIVTLGLGLAAVMTMLTLLAMLSADPLPGVSQHLYLGWVDSRELPRSGGKASDDSASPASLWKLARSEEHTSELQSLMRLSYAVFCLNKITITSV